MSDPKFAFEVVKLLLQVVWADLEVAPEEARALREFAVSAGLDGAELGTIDACLAGTERLPAPNLGLLREQRVEVLRAVQKLLKASPRLHEEEAALLDELTAMLR